MRAHTFAGFVVLLLSALPLGLAQAEASFEACVAQLQERAKAEGFSEQLVATLGQVNEIKRTIELDRNQPEFVQTFAGYFNQRVTDYRIERGRALLDENRELLKQLTQTYGIPGHYLVAFWGLESNYGSYIGKMPILDSLATLACDPRRSQFFAGELMLALQVMATHQVPVEAMQGSWAGAMGQTQFMPSAFVNYGVDGDGDQKVDLWSSQADALTSGANYLNHLGWQRERRWGREVRLPMDFPYHLAGINNRQPLNYWADLGVLTADGATLPGTGIRPAIEAALLVPNGSDGPKFLVYDNFDVIMKWNRSQFYALAVGHLADRINGAGRLRTPPPEDTPLTKDDIVFLQSELQRLGFYSGKLDGQPGPQTRQAIREYQKSRQLVADGYADGELLKQLGAP